jgi:toxin ParE1/3/4
VKFKSILVPKAKQELKEAFLWYENQEPGLGYEFLISADTARATIQRDPAVYPKVYRDIQRILVQRFPFAIYYAIRSDIIFILAIFHSRRNPDEWKKRWIKE